jgi:hypothetical protein
MSMDADNLENYIEKKHTLKYQFNQIYVNALKASLALLI